MLKSLGDHSNEDVDQFVLNDGSLITLYRLVQIFFLFNKKKSSEMIVKIHCVRFEKLQSFTQPFTQKQCKRLISDKETDLPATIAYKYYNK